MIACVAVRLEMAKLTYYIPIGCIIYLVQGPMTGLQDEIVNDTETALRNISEWHRRRSIDKIGGLLPRNPSKLKAG